MGRKPAYTYWITTLLAVLLIFASCAPPNQPTKTPILLTPQMNVEQRKPILLKDNPSEQFSIQDYFRSNFYNVNGTRPYSIDMVYTGANYGMPSTETLSFNHDYFDSDGNDMTLTVLEYGQDANGHQIVKRFKFLLSVTHDSDPTLNSCYGINGYSCSTAGSWFNRHIAFIAEFVSENGFDFVVDEDAESTYTNINFQYFDGPPYTIYDGWCYNYVVSHWPNVYGEHVPLREVKGKATLNTSPGDTTNTATISFDVNFKSNHDIGQNHHWAYNFDCPSRKWTDNAEQSGHFKGDYLALMTRTSPSPTPTPVPTATPTPSPSGTPTPAPTGTPTPEPTPEPSDDPDPCLSEDFGLSDFSLLAAGCKSKQNKGVTNNYNPGQEPDYEKDSCVSSKGTFRLALVKDFAKKGSNPDPNNIYEGPDLTFVMRRMISKEGRISVAAPGARSGPRNVQILDLNSNRRDLFQNKITQCNLSSNEQKCNYPDDIDKVLEKDEASLISNILIGKKYGKLLEIQDDIKKLLKKDDSGQIIILGANLSDKDKNYSLYSDLKKFGGSKNLQIVLADETMNLQLTLVGNKVWKVSCGN